MATGSLHAIYRFKVFSVVSLLTIPLLVFLLLTPRAEAAWYTIYGGGVLSGGRIINNAIPSQSSIDASGFISGARTIQHPNSPSGTGFGVLVSSDGQTVLSGGNSTDDPYVKDTRTELSSLDVAAIAKSANVTTYSSTCSTMLTNGTLLDPSKIYKVSNPLCLTEALGALGSTTYTLTSQGTAVLVLDSPNSIVTISNLIQAIDTTHRLVLITNARVVIADTVTDVQMAIISTNSNNLSVGTVQTPLLLEGPTASGGNVVFSRARTPAPGTVITYNPFYISELSQKGTDVAKTKNLYTSKTTWRYE